MRLVLCDDNRILCEALAVALEARGHRVVATATTVDDGLAAVARLHPDVCLLDLRFPAGPVGLDAAREIRARHPRTKVVLLSGCTDPATWSAARQAGVAGLLGKDQSVDQIAAALNVVAGGGSASVAVGSGSPPVAAPRRRGGLLDTLTPRETQVLRRIGAGQSTAQMAREMSIATSTLRTYVKTVLGKLGVHNRLQAAALAASEGLVGESPAA